MCTQQVQAFVAAQMSYPVSSPCSLCQPASGECDIAKVSKERTSSGTMHHGTPCLLLSGFALRLLHPPSRVHSESTTLQPTQETSGEADLKVVGPGGQLPQREAPWSAPSVSIIRPAPQKSQHCRPLSPGDSSRIRGVPPRQPPVQGALGRLWKSISAPRFLRSPLLYYLEGQGIVCLLFLS
jgi:hypothetical protein